MPPGGESLCARTSYLGAVEPKARGPWRVLASQIVIETPHLRLRRDAIELPGGRRIDDYYVRESRGFAVVFALTPDEGVVLVRQYKHGIGETVLELPAGGIDPGESPQACARRELAEETGYAGDPSEPEELASFIVDPTSASSRFHLFLARNARRVQAQSLDLTEEIAVELVPLAALLGLVRDGSIAVAPQVAAIYVVLDRLGRL